jgi:acetylornithine deacetylase
VLFAGVAVPYPISIGTVHAGDWPSSVPDLLVAEGRMGVIIGEDPDEARRQLVEAVADAASLDPWLRDNAPTVEWVGGQFASGRLPPAHPLLREVQAAAVDASGGLRAPPMPGAGPWGSDLRLYVGNRRHRVSSTTAPATWRTRTHRASRWRSARTTHVARTLALVAMRRCGVRGSARRTRMTPGRVRRCRADAVATRA